jgi:protein-S-isoprenylcysteine O-methyltransferase Ste14
MGMAGKLRNATVWLLVASMVALARPTWTSFALGLVPLAAGEALRLWAAGHLVKNEILVTSGPYRFTRNPLYLGRLLIFTGLCVIAHLPWGAGWIVLVLGWGVFFAYYLPRKERVEPERLRTAHGADYARYAAAVPALFPRLRPWDGGTITVWSGSRFRDSGEIGFLLALGTIVALIFVRLGV